MREDDVRQITGDIIDSAMKIHKMFGPGMLESVYERMLAIELKKRGHVAECQKTIGSTYEGEVFESADDTQPIIDRCKEEQLTHPEAFYTTQRFEIEMISCRGRWMVMMTGDFYKALSGYAI